MQEGHRNHAFRFFWEGEPGSEGALEMKVMPGFFPEPQDRKRRAKSQSHGRDSHRLPTELGGHHGWATALRTESHLEQENFTPI